MRRDLLDAPVVLADPPRRARVSDVVLDVQDGGAWVVGLDLSTGRALRRLVGTATTAPTDEQVRLSQVHLVSSKAHAAQLELPDAMVFGLEPQAMAELLTRLPVTHARDILRVADARVLEKALPLLHPHVLSRVTRVWPGATPCSPNGRLAAAPSRPGSGLGPGAGRVTAPAPVKQSTARRRMRRRAIPLLAVLGPGLLAGLSDDDPAGITTYSSWGLSTATGCFGYCSSQPLPMMVFHDLGARLGVVTGQGLIGLIRHRYGVGVSGAALVVLVTANLGTATAEFAGIAAGSELLGISRYVAVPLSAVLVSWLVLAGSFHRVEHVLMALAAVFVAYIGAGLLAHPDWSAALGGLVTPRMSFGHEETLIVAATVGTTLAPWGLSFIQSYAVDKKLTTKDLAYERTDVVLGAALTGVIGFFVVVACAATLNRRGLHIESAEDAAVALTPIAGDLASTLFAVGLIGAALLAAAVLPLSTAYSICDFTGSEAALDSTFSEARTFYLSNMAITAIAASVVLIPGVPLVTLLVSTQTLNAILLLPLLILMQRLARDHIVLGAHVVSRGWAMVQGVVVVAVFACVGLLLL